MIMKRLRIPLCNFGLLFLIFTLVAACSTKRPKGSQLSVKIDASRTSDPISPFIYGQFIEHLGRCIYGGIWAEMLQDRKFYFPVSDDYQPYGTQRDENWNAGDFKVLKASPWKVIGPKGTVMMNTSLAFVGEHSPEIKISGGDEAVGLGQSGLELLSSKEYQGYVLLAGSSSADVTVRISWGDPIQYVQVARFTGLKNDYTHYDFNFTAPDSINNVALEIVGSGSGKFRIGTVSLMPADNVEGFRPDVLALLKELNSPIYRWPGGNFVSGYNWRDGIGPRDKRPPRKNPAWTGVEPNDVGIHEFMKLCELIHAEPYIAVNTGLGTVDEVAEEVAYCNGPGDTPMGKLRSENGQDSPYNVKYWAVGNEMFGDWQLGHMPLEAYVQKHKEVTNAMWKVDPDIKLVGVGAVGEWSKTMLSQCADNMNYISEHIYCKEKDNLLEHVRWIKEKIKDVADAHREYRKEIPGLAQKDIRIAMDEWNYWYGNYVYGELGCRYYLKDALGIAMGFNEYYRNSDLYFMANYAQTVNVIGAIKTTQTAADFATTGLVLKLYRAEYGEIPVEVTTANDTLDVTAALTGAKDSLTVSVINPTYESKFLYLNLTGLAVNDTVQHFEIGGDDPELYNVPGEPAKVNIIETDQNLENLEIKPLSANIFRFKIK